MNLLRLTRIISATPPSGSVSNSFICYQARLYSDMASPGSKRVFTNSKGNKVLLPRLPPALSKVYVPGRMYKYQDKVKKLPVMSLEYIANKYLGTVEVAYVY